MRKPTMTSTTPTAIRDAWLFVRTAFVLGDAPVELVLDDPLLWLLVVQIRAAVLLAGTWREFDVLGASF